MIQDISSSEGSVTEPVTLSEAKTYMTVDFADDDALITSMIKAARQDIELYTNKALVPKSVVAVSKGGLIRLPYGTASDIEVERINDDNTRDVLVAEDDYYQQENQLRLYSGLYKITYTITPTVDETTKEAIKMLVTYRYNNRGNKEMPEDVLSKLNQLSDVWL